jgi:uroporphyrinogen decarboxylase
MAAEADRQPILTEPGISSPEHLGNIQPLDLKSGAYAEQIESLRLISEQLDGEAPFIQTVFSPLAVMSRITGSTKYVQKLMKENTHELMMALHTISGSLAAYARACLDAGAAGIFFATVEWGSSEVISAEKYETFGRPFDLPVLDAVKEAPFNVLHVCRDHNHLPALMDYPVAAFHWDVHAEGNPTLASVASNTDVALMGGVSHDRTMPSNSPADVAKEAERAIVETTGRKLLLAPGCSVEPTVPPVNLRALAQAARRPLGKQGR